MAFRLAMNAKLFDPKGSAQTVHAFDVRHLIRANEPLTQLANAARELITPDGVISMINNPKAARANLLRIVQAHIPNPGVRESMSRLLNHAAPYAFAYAAAIGFAETIPIPKHKLKSNSQAVASATPIYASDSNVSCQTPSLTALGKCGQANIQFLRIATSSSAVIKIKINPVRWNVWGTSPPDDFLFRGDALVLNFTKEVAKESTTAWPTAKPFVSKDTIQLKAIVHKVVRNFKKDSPQKGDNCCISYVEAVVEFEALHNCGHPEMEKSSMSGSGQQ